MDIETVPEILEILWERKFFEKGKTLTEIIKTVGALGYNPSRQNMNAALTTSKFLRRIGSEGKYKYIQKSPSKGISLNEDIFPEKLISSLGRDFEIEIHDLRLNYGRSGACTAFLLRKILEKLIFLAFAKNGMVDKLKGTNEEYVTLKTMLDLATKNNVQGEPFLMPKTAKQIEGIKFLGDTAAHNPLMNVDMKVIIPVMPFIITAYEELSKKL